MTVVLCGRSCLVGLFALSVPAQNTRGSLPQAVMMGFALMCTAELKLKEDVTSLRGEMSDAGETNNREMIEL
jgi:hypothetical protein